MENIPLYPAEFDSRKEQNSQEESNVDREISDISQSIQNVKHTNTQSDIFPEAAKQTKFALFTNMAKMRLASRRNIFAIVLLFLFNIMYWLSLKGCPHRPVTISKCSEWLSGNAAFLVLWLVLSCVLLTSLIILSFCQRLNSMWILSAAANLCGYLIYDSGTDYVRHGMFNFFIACFGVFLSTFLHFCIKGIIFIYKKGIIHFLVTICTIAYLYFRNIYGSCDGWEHGIGDTQLKNLKGECVILKPSYCELSITDGWFDINQLTQACLDFKMTVKTSDLNARLQSRPNLKRIGYPRIEDYPNKAKYDDKYLHKIIADDFIDMDDPEVPQQVKDNIEFVLDVSDSNAHILHVELKKNQTRADEAKLLRQQVLDSDRQTGNVDRIDKDVLVFYIDNISRPNFHRKLKKLSKWLDEFADGAEIGQVEVSLILKYQKKDKIIQDNKKNNVAYEYFKYHSFANFSLYNNVGLFDGVDGELITESSYVLRYFKDNGYIIGFFSDECFIEEILWTNETIFDKPFMRYDHLAASLACDSNYGLSNKMSILPVVSYSSVFRRCMYGKSMHEIQLDYIMQFWQAYPDNRKLFKTRFLDTHEATGEVIKYSDEDFVAFFSSLKDKGYLNDTIVYIVSDHGQHFVNVHIPLIPDDSRYEENYLPLLIVLTPTDIPEHNLKYLKENQQHFTTSTDIYSSLKSIAVGRKATSEYVKSYSLLHEMLPSDRDCDTNTEMHFDVCWCSNKLEKTQKQLSGKGLFYIQFGYKESLKCVNTDSVIDIIKY